MESTNGIPVPDKDFLDIGIVVDNWKLNAFSKRLAELNYKATVTPFTHSTTTLKIMQVPKEELEALSKVIKKLEHDLKRSN